MNLRDLFLRIRALVAPQRVERELDEELAFHIERETQKHIAAGLSPVDDLTRDIPYAFRTFRRAPLAALTIVATVARGLGLVAVVFTVYDILFLRADAVRSPGELFAVELEQRIGPDNEPDVVFTRSAYDAMRRETSVFTDAFAMLDVTLTRIEGRLAASSLAQTGRSRATLDWRVVAFLVAGAIVSTVFFGLAPALQATRLDLLPTMRGQVMRDARPRGARHALIAVQVGASALLLICAAVFLRGAFAAATKDPGVRTSDTVRISIESEPRRAALLQALTAHPLVAIVAASSRTTRGAVETSLSPSRVSVDQLAVSSEYFNVLGFEVVSGRNFRRVERTADAGVAIVSETIARRLWPNGDGVGQQVRLDAPQSASPGGRPLLSRTLTVVGVVRNPGRDSGGVYVPTSPETPETALFLRVRGNPEQARQLLLERLSSIDPALSNIMTVRAMAGMQAYTLQIAFWVAVVLGGLALVLTVSGLFSVLSYVVEQRANEIGVRMALGATTRNIAGLVLSQSLGPIGIGLMAGGGIGAALAIVLMAMPVASEIPDIVHVFDPVAYAASLLVIVTSCALAVSVPALRAARIDPIATLRKD
jgi:ABC-type lipoprotein release transport system permease subunit